MALALGGRMERSWLKKSKWHGEHSYAVKNLSQGFLSVGKGTIAPGKWALNLTEWEVSRRGFLTNVSDKWLCITMSEYHEMMTAPQEPGVEIETEIVIETAQEKEPDSEAIFDSEFPKPGRRKRSKKVE